MYANQRTNKSGVSSYSGASMGRSYGTGSEALRTSGTINRDSKGTLNRDSKGYGQSSYSLSKQTPNPGSITNQRADYSFGS